jgi:uncharacterized protein YjiS (DUF1127 family)
MFTARLLARLARTRRRRIATLDLASLSDHQLRDIGVTRHDLFTPHTNR